MAEESAEKKYITISEVCELYDLARSTVAEYMDKNIVPSVVDAKTGKRKLLRKPALAAIDEYQVTKTQAGKKQILASEYNKAKALSETYKARMARLSYEERLGELIRVNNVETRLFELAIQVRDSMLNIPNQISPELASMVDEKKINMFLDKTIRDALTDISKSEIEKWNDKKLRGGKKKKK